jgi:asparagine synthase (glutamine-hydrolysing)
LYVHEKNGTVWFASEVKALLADPEVARALDIRGIDQTFTYWAPIAPISVFQDIEEFPPASVRVYEPEGRRRERLYWSPVYPSRRGGTMQVSMREAAEGLREKLERATQLRLLRADMPVGSYLSGGLDSSMVAWMGRQSKAGEFSTFSLRFEDAEFDETPFQKVMIDALGSSHREITVRRSDIARVFPDVVYHCERPVLRTAPAPLFLLSRLVHEAGIKAVLTGEGADEMLAGYDLFKEAAIRTFWASQPDSTIRPALFSRLYPYMMRSPQKARGLALDFWRQGLDRVGQPGFSHEPRWRTTSALKRLFSREVKEELRGMTVPSILDSLPDGFRLWDPLSQAQYLEVQTLLSGYLISSQGDRMLMAHSVEGRFPFLDVDVMEYCNSLPPQLKLVGLNEKAVLKEAAKGMIPECIIRRHKQPYRAPDAVCFVGDDAPEYVANMLSTDAVREAGIFDAGAVQALRGKCHDEAQGGHHAFSNTDNMAIVGILSLQLLYHQFIVEKWAAPGVRFTRNIDRYLVDAH